MDTQRAAWGKTSSRAPIEALRIQLAEREVTRVGKVEEDDVERVVRLAEPNHGVGGYDANARVVQRASVQAHEHGLCACEVRHALVEVDDGHALHVGPAQHFSRCEAVAAASAY